MRRDPEWGAEFQRLVLACAVGGDLMVKLPSAVQPTLFGSAAGGTTQSPRQRIAAALAGHQEKYGGRPPVPVFEEMLRVAGARLGEAERGELLKEVARVLAFPVPADQGFVFDQVREWAEYNLAAQAALKVADLLDAGPSALPAIREALTRGAEPIEQQDGRPRTEEWLGGADARLEAWRRGDEYGERIPTGFPELDAILHGGPTRRETFYFMAPPKGAKTASLLHLVRAASRRGFGVYVATYEMQAIRMALRLDRGASRQSKEELREDTVRLERAFAGLRSTGAGEVVIDERPPQARNCVQGADRRIDQLRREGKRVDEVVLDYLNIMGSGAREEQEKRHELSKISREISKLAKDQDVLVWSAVLTKRAAVNKAVVRKEDIAEVYEVISVMDGGVAICGTKEMVASGYRRFYVMAAREEADEVRAGDYRVDFARMTIDTVDGKEVDAVLASQEGRLGE